MNAYLSVRRLPDAPLRASFDTFTQRFTLEVISEIEAAVTWNPLIPEGESARAVAKTTLYCGPSEATWTIEAHSIAGPPTLARWSNLFRIGGVAMELVRRDFTTSWTLWTDVVTQQDQPDDRFALAIYPPRDEGAFVRCGGAAYHRYAPVSAIAQFNELRMDVDLRDHPYLRDRDWFDLRKLFGQND